MVNIYLVWCRLEFDTGDVGNLLGDFYIEATLSVQALSAQD